MPQLRTRLFRPRQPAAGPAVGAGADRSTSSSAGWSAAGLTIRRPIPSPRWVGRALPGRRVVRGRRDDQSLHRRAGQLLLPARPRGLPEPAARGRRSSALLHRCDHRDAQAVARQPLQPVQPACRRPAVADLHAGRTGLIRHPPVACPADAPLGDALQRMADARVRTLVVEAADGAPVGMFTLVDLLRRVALPGRSLATPLAEVMTTPIVALPATATAYEAMHVMAERAIRQIAVVDGGRLKGVVNERDLFALQRVSMRQVIEGLHGARSVDELKRAGEDIRRLTLNLLAQGVGAEPLTRTIASLNDALSRRLLEAGAGRHDLTDCDWCWLALGSEGRGEQTFATDQDNALIFTAADDDERERHRERLLAFARDVTAALDPLGFPLCTGNVMASNPELCLSVEEWRGKFLGWVRTPTPRRCWRQHRVRFPAAARNAVLADALREWLFDYTRDNKVFLRFMVENALQVEPPLGLIRTFATDDDPAHKGSFDLKARGTRLFVDAARVFALGRGIADTGTAARLRLAGRALGVEARHVDATIDGFHFLQLLRLRQQDSPGGMASANRIDPYALNEVEQRMLKSFRQAKKLQQLTRQLYLA
ncbi:MAG: CBS domain-containing protein [Betaproteobacteria bacterium]|nr:CBS domain-containing protein [Betaproteobacteria bacterium]